MANLDVGTGSDAGPPDAAPGPPGPPGRPPFPGIPGPMQRRMGVSTPGAGNVGDALQKIADATRMLQDAAGSMPHGSKEGQELNRAIGMLMKIGPQQSAVQQTSITGARDALQQMIQGALAGRAGGIMQGNPQQPPATGLPGA